MTQACERADQHSAKAYMPLGELQCYAQSGRLGHDQMTFRDADIKRVGVVGTAVEVSCALIAIFENYQQADGSIAIPEVLRKWVGKERIGASDE